MTDTIFEGGCLCGSVRYRASGAPVVITNCHCTDCRKAAGAPFVTWAEFLPGAFELVSGEARIYESISDAGLRVHRHFCPVCGSLLTYRRPDTDQGIDVTTATLDDPHTLEPTDEVWTTRKLAWIETGRLPRSYIRGRDRPST